jgi:hypothetical protein
MATQTDKTQKQSPDQVYDTGMKTDLASLIDGLQLDDFKKRVLKGRWLDQVEWLGKRSRETRDRYYRLRVIAIVGGILTPILVSVGQVDKWGWMGWVAMAVGAVVAVAVGIEGFFRYGDRWRNYRGSCEVLKSEGWSFFQLTGPYGRYNTHADAYEHFAGRVESIIQADVQTYITEIVAERDKKDGGTPPSAVAGQPPAGR